MFDGNMTVLYWVAAVLIVGVFVLVAGVYALRKKPPLGTRPRTLKDVIYTFEDHIITLSGPALATSGVIAGIDVLTSNVIAQHAPQVGTFLGVIWAFSLMLTLDFQVLTIGVRVQRIGRHPQKSGTEKFWLIVLMLVIAGAISFVSIQMGAIFARQLETGQSLEEAQAALGINPIALIYERHAMVMLLIFMSGFLRDESREDRQDQTGSVQSQGNEQMAEMMRHLAEAITTLTTQQAQMANTVNGMAEGGERGDGSMNNARTQETEKRMETLTDVVGKLAHSVEAMQTTVTEIHADLHSVQVLPTGERLSLGSPTQVRDVGEQVGSAQSGVSSSALGDGGQMLEKEPVIPVLEVLGVSPEAVRRVLQERLRGKSWRNIPGNYTRTIKPVKEVYERMVQRETVGKGGGEHSVGASNGRDTK